MKNQLIYEYFTDDDFLRISDCIGETEKITSGEIRVSIKENKQFSDRKKSIVELAEKEFYNLKMDQTRDKTGILLYLCLSDKKFHILADEGINGKVDQKIWDEIRDDILSHFLNGNFCKGILAGIKDVGKVLAKYFPIKHDDTNELSNKVVL